MRELERLRGSARPRPDRAAASRSTIRCCSSARTASTTAAARATAGRSTRRSPSWPRRTGSGRARTSAATASRATSSSCRRASTSGASAPGTHGRCSTSTSPAGSTSPTTGGARATRSPSRPRSGPSARPPGCWAIDDLELGRAERGRRSCFRGGGRVFEVDVTRDAGPLTLPDVQRRRRSGARGTTPQESSRTSRLTSTRRLSSSSSPGKVGGGEGAVGRDDRLQLGARVLGERSRACPRTRASAVQVGDHRRPPLQRRLGRERPERSDLLQLAVEDRPPAVATSFARARRVTSSAWSLAASRSTRSEAMAPSSGTDRRNSTSSSHSSRARRSASTHVMQVDPHGDVERVGLRGERVVQPAARKIERVSGAQRQLERRRARARRAPSNTAGRLSGSSRSGS